jgi:AraC family transcriptional regulator of adaptative response/methylated-DNA-[protein]-cysteine methyltransferase
VVAPLHFPKTAEWDTRLYLLEFSDGSKLDKEIERLQKNQNAIIIPRETDVMRMIATELRLYFSGTLQSFKTPLHPIGSDFQQCAWHLLQPIPYGQTISYKKQAEITGNKNAYRAVANANGANQLAIVVSSCH